MTSQNNILSSRLPFKASRAALGLILSTFFLALLLTFSTLENINRSQVLMERFLLQKGETIIRTIEASMRTSIMHHMGSGDPLKTLLAETSGENDIIFIVVTDKDGYLIAKTANAPEFDDLGTEISQVLTSEKAVTSMDKETGVFIISKRLQLNPRLTHFTMMNEHRRSFLRTGHRFDEAIISIGLFTEEFDDARKQDVEHAVFMGAILFLVGSAGLYLLFLYHSVRVTRSTLANMKLYTDNVMESIPVGLVTLDTEDHVVSCNRKTEEILGRKSAEITNRSIKELFPECGISTADICNSILDYSIDCITGSGRNVPVKIGGSSLMNNEGNVIGTVLVIRDMSMIKEMEQQLERSRRMAALGKMAAGIAHEIRNPLGTLRGFAHYFGNLAGANEDSVKYAELMKSEVDRLNRNISGLLQFARPREPQFVPTNLDKLISKTVTLMENDFSRKQLDYNWQCDTDVVVEIDPDLILQVLMNILKNSINATPPGGAVSVSATEDVRTVRMTIMDTGSGMTEHEQEKMFDPFFTTRKAGTGLGLAVSHQIIEQHNGLFEVRSTPGEGTTITIIFPKTQVKSDAIEQS